MGLGAKIKEALKGDDHSSTADTSNTPGAYPSEHTPQTYREGDNVGSTAHSSSAHRTENFPGKTTSDDTYGSTTGQPGHSNIGASEARREHGLAGTSGLPGTTGNTNASGSHGNKLTKANKSEPYWGDSERLGSDQLGTHSGTTSHGRGESTLNPHDVNDRYHNTTGTTTSGHAEGTHGGHSSRVANAADPRIDSDRDHRAAPTSVQGGSGHQAGTHSTTTTSGLGDRTYGSSTGTGHNTAGRDVLGNSGHHTGTHGATTTSGYGDQSHIGGTGTSHNNTGRDVVGSGRAPGQDYDPTSTSHSTATGGTSNLAHRPLGNTETAGTHRDHRIDEYGAPTHSSDRGHGDSHGHGVAGAGAGATAGYGAAKFADSHREHGLIQSQSPQTGNEHDLIAPHSSRSGVAANTDPGMLDPYDKTRSSTTASGAHGSTGGFGSSGGAPEGTAGHHNSRLANAADPRIDSDLDSSRGAHGTHGTGGAQGSHGLQSTARDSGFPHGDNASIGSSEHGSGRDRFGPGHEGAKVMHKCYNCGADNDITKHFQKEAVYRIG